MCILQDVELHEAVLYGLTKKVQILLQQNTLLDSVDKVCCKIISPFDNVYYMDFNSLGARLYTVFLKIRVNLCILQLVALA